MKVWLGIQGCCGHMYAVGHGHVGLGWSQGMKEGREGRWYKWQGKGSKQRYAWYVSQNPTKPSSFHNENRRQEWRVCRQGRKETLREGRNTDGKVGMRRGQKGRRKCVSVPLFQVELASDWGCWWGQWAGARKVKAFFT